MNPFPMLTEAMQLLNESHLFVKNQFKRRQMESTWLGSANVHTKPFPMAALLESVLEHTHNLQMSPTITELSAVVDL